MDYRIEADATKATSFNLYINDLFAEECFWLTGEDAEESMRAMGLVPLEKKYPGQTIRGYAEMGETLYVRP